MRKIFLIYLVAIPISCLLFIGCSDATRPASPQKTSAVDTVLGEQTGAAFTLQPTSVVTLVPTSSVPATPVRTEAPAQTPDSGGIDIDLTVMNSTMVYSEVYNMMVDPGAYVGKTVKIIGTYSALYYEPTGLYYHYAVIADATACCSQGLEFIWNGDHFYPDDYPADGTEIELVGVFGTYEELDYTYPYIAVDDIIIRN